MDLGDVGVEWFLRQQAALPTKPSLWEWIWKLSCPKKLQVFNWKSMQDWLPTQQYLLFSWFEVSANCPRCNNPETTIHVLRDCPWAKDVWICSPGILPLEFFSLPLQEWLIMNSKSDTLLQGQQIPWKIFSSFLCCQLWLSLNDCIFNKHSSSQSHLIYKAVQHAIEFFYLATKFVF